MPTTLLAFACHQHPTQGLSLECTDHAITASHHLAHFMPHHRQCRIIQPFHFHLMCQQLNA
jgi:hypothetical protein